MYLFFGHSYFFIFHFLNFYNVVLVSAMWVSEWVKALSRVQLFATPWTVAHQAPPSMGFSRQEYWSGLPFPSPGDLPDPRIEPRSLALQEDSLTSEPPGVSAIQQCKSAVIIHTSRPSRASLPSCHPIPPVYHRVPDWVPHATQRLLTSYPSYTW